MNSKEQNVPYVFVVRDFTSEGLEQTLQNLVDKKYKNDTLIVPGLEDEGGEILRDVVLPGIIEAKRVLVLADEPNANVGFEAGLALGFGKPTVVVSWRTELPEWLQRSPFINTLVHRIDKLAQLEDLLTNEEVWKKIDPRSAPSFGRPDIPSTKFLSPLGCVGSFFTRVQKDIRPFWNYPPVQNFTIRDLPCFFHDALQVVWVIAGPVDNEDKRDGVDNACNAVIAGWYCAQLLDQGNSSVSARRFRENWDSVTRGLRVLRERSSRPIRDIELLEKTFEGPTEFAALLRDIPDPRLDQKAPTVPFTPRAKEEATARPLPELFLEQVKRIQARSQELAESGKIDRALDELQAGDELTTSLVAEWPDNLLLQVMRGFLLKSLAQTLRIAGHKDHAARARERAMDSFQEVVDTAKERSEAENVSLRLPDEIGNALKGMGALFHEEGQLERAIDCYQQVTRVIPQDPYAWHDLFGAYMEIRKVRPVEVGLLRKALDKTKTYGEGQPGLGAHYLSLLEGRLAVLERPMGNGGKMFGMGAHELCEKYVDDLVREEPNLADFRQRATESSFVDHEQDPELGDIEHRLKEGKSEHNIETLSELIRKRESVVSYDDPVIARARATLAEQLASSDRNRACELAEAAAQADPLSAQAWHGIGNVRFIDSNFEGALAAYRRWAVLLHQRDPQRFIYALEALAGAYRQQEQEYRVEMSMRAALGVANALGDKPSCARLSLWLGQYYLASSGLSMALGFANKAFTLYHSLNDEAGVARALACLAESNRQMGNIKEAERMAREALVSFDKTELRGERAQQYGQLGAVLMDQKLYKDAREMWERARNLWQEIGNTSMVETYNDYLTRYTR